MQLLPHLVAFDRVDPYPATDFGRLTGRRATDMPTAELLQSLRHWLTAHPAPADMRAQVDALVAADTRALEGRA